MKNKNILVYTILLALTFVFNLFYIDFSKAGFAVIAQLATCVVGFVFLYFFYRGKNWARVMFLIGSFLSIVEIGQLFSVTNMLQVFDILFDIVLAVALIAYLFGADAREYFSVQPCSWKRVAKSGAWVIGVFFALVLAAAAAVFGFAKLYHQVVYLQKVNGGTFLKAEKIADGSVPKISRSGRYVAFHFSKGYGAKEEQYVNVYDREKNAVTVHHRTSAWARSLAWGPDDASILYFSTAGKKTELRQFFLADGDDRLVQEYATLLDEPELSPDCRQVAYFAPDEKGVRQVFVADRENGKPVPITKAANMLQTPQELFWSGDSRSLGLKILNEIVIVALDGSGAKEFTDTSVNMGTARGLQFDPNSDDLVYFIAQGLPGLSVGLYEYSLSGKKTTLLRSASLLEMFFDLSPDESYLVY